MGAPSASRSWRIWAVLVGFAAGWFLLSIQQHVWDEGAPGQLPYLPDAWYPVYERLYRQIGAPAGLSPYYFWGRFTCALYVVILIGAWGLPKGSRPATAVCRLLLLAGIAVAGTGDVIAYWGGRGAGLSSLTGVGFGLVEVPGLLLTLAAMVGYGICRLREGGRPVFAGWVMVGGALAATPVAFLALTYIPHGVLVTILATVGVALSGYHRHPDDGSS